MEQTKLLTVLVALTLLASIVNAYSNFAITNILNTNSLTGALIADAQNNNENDNADANLALPSSRGDISADDDAVKGSANAPVTIIEFSDYQCPFCAKFFNDAFQKIDEKYIKTGKVKFVYRDFPLDFHQFAQKASEASECAREQNKFWEFNEKLFKYQASLDIASLKKYAKELSLDQPKFDDCLDSGSKASEVRNDFNDGIKYGVAGTPAFFVNGVSLSGALPFEAFEKVILQELKNK